MAKTVKWNRVIYDEFNRLAMLTEVEQKILETRIKGWTVKMQATELNMAESTVHAYIRQIKKKYDEVQPHSDILPPRRHSAKEDYMDTH